MNMMQTPNNNDFSPASNIKNKDCSDHEPLHRIRPSLSQSMSMHSMSCTNSSHFVVSLEMLGHITVRNPVPHNAFEELVRKTALLISAHFQFKSQSPWEALRPYVASSLYKFLIICSEQVLEQMDVELSLKKAILNEVVDPKTDELMEEIEGCQEMIVAGNILVVVYYKLAFMTKTWQARSNFDSLDVMPTPHRTWFKLIKQIDRLHTLPLQSKFCGYLVDDAVTDDIKANPLVYKEAFSKKADLLV